MFCPSCGKEIANGSVYCNFCGKRTDSFVTNSNQTESQTNNHPYRINMGNNTGNDNNQSVKKDAEPDYQQIALKKELNYWKQKNIKPYIIISAVFVFVGIFGSFVHMFAEGVLACIAISVGCLCYIYNRHDKIRILETKLDRINKIKICPYCKSPNLEMNMVQAGNTISKGKTTISENINPLRPFTHVNVKHGNVNTYTRYTNMFHCLSCGKVFHNPQYMSGK